MKPNGNASEISQLASTLAPKKTPPNFPNPLRNFPNFVIGSLTQAVSCLGANQVKKCSDLLLWTAENGHFPSNSQSNG